MKKFIGISLLMALMCSLFACTGGKKAQPADKKPQLIAHAGGAVYGYRLTNSAEAIDSAYKNGYRYIELDFERTSDGEYVLLHDWESMAKRMLFKEGVRTKEEFFEAEKFLKLTLMDTDMLIDWLLKHKDCRIITDAKCENFEFLQTLRSEAGEVADNFIPQVYSYKEFEKVRAIGYEDIILTLYRMEAVDTAELSAFAKEAQPWAVTLPQGILCEEILNALNREGICTYTHTVNDLSYFEKWHDKGLYGIYTDYFYPEKWKML